MRKRSAVGATEAGPSSSGTGSAEEDLFAAEQRLGGDQPAAEPEWSDDDEDQSNSGAESHESQEHSEGSDSEQEVDSEADSEASSKAEDSPSDDDELDTAIVDYAAAARKHVDEVEQDALALT